MIEVDNDACIKEGQLITNVENKISFTSIKHLRVEIKMLQDADSICLNDTLKIFTHCSS